jgi:putative DNA primase/helicase
MSEPNLDSVRRVLADAQDVDLPEGMTPHPEAEAGQGDDDWLPDFDGVNRGAPPPPAEDGEEEPPEARCVHFPLNDFGNGQRLIEHFGADLLRVERVGWFVWTGQCWRLDPDSIAVRRLAHRLTDLIAKETWHIPIDDGDAAILAQAEVAQEELDALGVIPAKDRTPDQLQEMAALSRIKRAGEEIKDQRNKSIGRRLTHAKNAGNSNSMNNMMVEGGAIVARTLEDLDASPLDINTEGGVLRITFAPGEDDGGANPAPRKVIITKLDHAREYLLTKMMPVGLNPWAQCPAFMRFIERIQPSAEMRGFIQRWFGYSMTGLTNEQKFAFFYGSGANGKSVLVDLVAKILGDYAASAKIESITGKSRRGGGEATPDLMPLIGARFVRSSEPDEGQRLQEALIKDLTGGEPILVRALNKDFVSIYPFFKLTIQGNHKPEIHGGDDGIWRRVMLVPFDIQIPPEERDPDLGKKLFEERDGIMNWLIEGLRDYLTHGLRVPSEVSAATDEYREDSDPMAAFLTQCCGVSGRPEHSVSAKDMSSAFALWMDDGGRGAWRPGTIFKRLKAKAGKWKHPSTGQMFQARKSSESFYDGVEFIEPFRTRFTDFKFATAGQPKGQQYDDFK